MLRNLLAHIARPYLIRELPGWGRVYKLMVGGHEKQEQWADALPRIIRDKRNGYIRVLDIREWADRSLYFLGRWYDLPTALAVEAALRPGDRVVDMGGNYGHFTLAAAHAVGPSGAVLTAEPNPVAYARLRTHIALNKIGHVDARNIGIAAEPGELTLTIPSVNSGEASFAPSDYDDNTSVTCPVETLDALVGTDTVDLIKIDVEGFELEVLRGAMAVLERDQPVLITEVVEKHLARANASRASLFALLEPIGYRAYRLDVHRQGLQHTLVMSVYDKDSPDDDVIWVTDRRKDRLAGSLPN